LSVSGTDLDWEFALFLHPGASERHPRRSKWPRRVRGRCDTLPILHPNAANGDVLELLEDDPKASDKTLLDEISNNEVIYKTRIEPTQ
jgi:hypothetical protein